MHQTSPPLSPRDALPIMYDLPSEDPEEPGLPDEFHLLQPELLRQTFQPPTYGAEDFFTTSDLNLYYDVQSLLVENSGVWLEKAQLGLGLWQGSYQGVNRRWLRWYDEQQNWILTPAEREAQRVDHEKSRADRLAAKLKVLGIDPDEDGL